MEDIQYMKRTGYKGIVLEQNKAPVLSKGIKTLPRLPVKEEYFTQNPNIDVDSLTSDDYIEICKQARIIDESDGKFLWKKLEDAVSKHVSLVVIDLIDDEPYISSQLCLAVWMNDELKRGIDLIMRATSAEGLSVEVYKNIFDLDIKIPRTIGPYKVRRIGGNYPIEQRERSFANKKNAVVIGAGALVHLQRAVFEGRVQTSAFVSVAGDSIANPANYELPVGATVQQVLDEVGTIILPKRVVIGGSMTGVSVENTDAVTISAVSRGVLAFAELFGDMGFTCIGCGRCIDACPQDLSPQYLYRLLRARKTKEAMRDAKYCIGCGACSYVCPAKLDLVHIIYGTACAERKKGVNL